MGDADFSSMEVLDGDNGPLKDKNGRQVARDIVQFVEFRESMKKGNLGEQVLKEVPNQFCKAMEMIGYNPVAIAQVVEFNE